MFKCMVWYDIGKCNVTPGDRWRHQQNRWPPQLMCILNNTIILFSIFDRTSVYLQVQRDQ